MANTKLKIETLTAWIESMKKGQGKPTPVKEYSDKYRKKNRHEHRHDRRK